MPDNDMITLGVNIDITTAEQQIAELKQSLGNLRQTIDEAPNATNAFNLGLDKAISAADLLLEKINKAYSQNNTEDNFLLNDLSAGISELSTLKNLFSDNGAFSTSIARNLFSGFSDSVKHELDTNISAISSMIKTNIGTLKSKTLAGMAGEILETADAQQLFGRFSAVNGQEYKSFIQALLPHVAPAYLLGDYRRARYGTTSANASSASPAELIPAGFRSSYDAKQYVSRQSNATGFMQPYQRNYLRDLVARNDAAMRAAAATKGMMQYNDAGQASFAYNITPAMYNQFRHNLFDDFVRRASGKQSERINLFDDSLSQSEERRLLGRMTSSSAGRALYAMSELEKLADDKSWGGGEIGKGYQKLDNVVKSSLEQYEVAKYRFDNLFNNKGDHNLVTVSESANTRMLGLQGHHNDFTDKMLLVSLAGYDKNNEEQQKYLENLLSGQAIGIPGMDKKYIAQNIHGTGSHTVLRMIEQQEYERVKKQEEAWAKEQGFTGFNFWNDFVDENFDFGTIKDLRRHYDATGKGWSPGSKMHSNFGKDFNDKKFAIVDLSDEELKKKFADGIGWFADGILPVDDAQVRLGTAGKGTLHNLKGFKTLGEWAVASGLANSDGRFIVKGPRGDIDLTDYSGMVDKSMVKNMQTYANLKTGEDLNKGFTAMLQRYGGSVMADYESAETRARGLGSQAMAFIKLSPAMQQEQINEYARRMRLLDTEAGVREYLLGDPDNYLGQQVRNGTVSIGSKLVQSWVNSERQSLMERMASGEWIDFGEQPSVINQKVNKTPIASLLGLSSNATKAEILQHIRDQYKKKKGKELQISDEELSGYFALDKGQIVDFARPEETEVSVQRSPSGLGNFVYGKNYAKGAKELYEMLGLSTSGVYLSEYDMNKLGGADFDGDAVKTLYGNIGKAVKEAAIIHDELVDRFSFIKNPETKPVELKDIEDFHDSNKHKRLFTEASIDAVPHMGSSSSSGMRATMFDLTNPQNRDYLIAAIQGNAAYVDTSAEAKNATETEVTDKMKKALGQGAQWSRLPTRFSRFFNVTGDEDVDKPNDEDIFTANVNGQEVKINMAELRDVGFDRINMRSIFSGADLGGLRAATELAKGGVDMTRAYALIQALDEGVGYGSAGPATKALMKTMRQMKVLDMVNPNRMLNDEELGRLEEMIGEAERETNRQNADKSTGEKMQALNELGITAAKNFIERGIHEKNMNALYGEENAKNDFKELYDNQTAEVVIEGNEEYRKLLAYRRMAQNVQESEEKVKDIDNAILAREEQLNKIKEKLPEKDRGRFESDMSEQEWADVSNTIFGADNTEEGYTEQQEVSRVYENARQIAAAEGIDLDQTQKEISDLKNKKQEIQAQSANVGDLYGYIKAQERFNRADEFGKSLRSELISNIIKKQAEVDETPEADSYFRQRMYKANTGHKIFEALKNSDDFKHKQFTAEEEEAILKAISPTEGFIAETYEDYGVTAETKAKRLFERFERQNGKTGQQGILNQQFERYDEALKDVEAYRDRIIKILNEDDLHDDVRAKLTNSLNEVEKNISKAKVEINETKDFRQRQLDESFRQREAQTELRGQQELLQAQRAGIQVEQMNRNWQTHTLTDPFTRNYLQRRSMYDQYRGQVGNSKLQLNQAKEAQRRAREAEKLARDPEDKKNAKAQYDNASAAVSHWEEVLRSAREGMKEFGDENGEFNAAFQMTAATIETVSTAADKLIQNFGRQVLRNAFNEAKNFVVQFDSQMRTIQAITMKTDEQMQSVKQATVDRAIELRTSVANVAQVEADLYRQGLNDEQVEERSDAIIKFATVTGAKVGDAGKAITTAIQNGLVSSAEEAMDVMTALGDSAATTANEIFKGIQKSAAAAKVAGVSYDELTTLLTIGTSKTQLSGNVIGTGLQTIFSRMNRVTNEGYANDENGNTTTINDVEKALKSAGVQLRTEDGRSFRGSFDVLRDLSRVWSGLSDIQRSNVTYTMAGGRQTNMFTTLMEGMSEDGGAWLDELLGLAEGSEGTTENKYAIAAKSITASLNELKSTYDGIVENLAGGGVITSGIDMVTSLVSGFKDLTDSAPAVVAGAGIIGTALVGLFAKIASGLAMANMASGPAGLISTLIALVAGGAMFGGVSLGGSLLKNYKESKDEGLQRQKREEAAQQFSDLQKERLKPVNDEINKVEELGKAWENAGKKSGTKEWEALSSALTSLQNQLGLTSTAFNDGSTAIDNWAASVEEARNKVNGIQQASDELTDMAKDESMRVEAEKIFSEHDKSIQFAENIGANVSAIEKGIYKSNRLRTLQETKDANNLAYSAYLDQYDQEKLDKLAKDNKYKLNILDGISDYNEIYDEKAGEFTETVQGNLSKLAAIEYLDQNVFKNKNEPITESEKQLVELWNAFTQSEVRYNKALAENRISSNDPSKWSPEETIKMYDAMINFAGSDMKTDIVLANEKFDNSKEDLIRKTIKNSTQLNTLFGGNQDYLDAIAEQAVQQLSGREFADSTEYANALTDFRQSVVEEYSGRSKEFLDKTLNYKNYDNQIEYIDSQGKKVIFGVNGNVTQEQAEVLAKQYEDERSEKFEPTLNVQNNIVVNVNGEQVSTTTTTTLDNGTSQTTTDTEEAPSTTPAKSSGHKTYEPIATVAGGPFASDVIRPPLTDNATSDTQTKTVEELKAEIAAGAAAAVKGKTVGQTAIDTRNRLDEQHEEWMNNMVLDDGTGVPLPNTQLIEMAEEARRNKAGNVDKLKNMGITSVGDVINKADAMYRFNKPADVMNWALSVAAAAGYDERRLSAMGLFNRQSKVNMSVDKAVDIAITAASDLFGQRYKDELYDGKTPVDDTYKTIIEQAGDYNEQDSKQIEDKLAVAAQMITKNIDEGMGVISGAGVDEIKAALDAVDEVYENIDNGVEDVFSGEQFINLKDNAKQIIYNMFSPDGETRRAQRIKRREALKHRAQKEADKRAQEASVVTDKTIEHPQPTVRAAKSETQALDTAATELDNTVAETQESVSEIVENVNEAETIVANVDEVKEANDQVNQKIAEAVSGVTVKRQEKKIPKLSDVIQDLSVQTQLNDLTGQYASFLNYAQQTSSFQGLENLLANNNIDPSVFKQIFSSDQTLLKMYNDSTTGGRQYTYNQFLEQLRAGALGETLSQIVPRTISEANTYNQSRAALTAVMNGTATAEQYESVASQWGLDRNTFMANKDVYTMLEGSRLNIQKQTMEQNAELYLQKQMDDFIKDNQERILAESSGKESTTTLFNQMWGEYIKTAKNQEQLDSMMKAYRAAGYTFKIDEGGQITATYKGQALGPEDQLNPYAWNRNLGRSQARADIMEYLQNGELSGEDVDQRIQNMENYSSEVAQYIALTDEARKSTEGLALLEQIRIKVHVDGLDDLVALGQMSQEAVTWATQLATGGTMKFDARRAIRASTLETSQLGGLANAAELTPEMRQAMMQYLNIDETTFNTKDWTEWQKELRNELSSQEFITALQNNYAEAYKAADDESKKLIKANAEKLGGKLIVDDDTVGFAFGPDWFNNTRYQANESLADITKHYTADKLQAEMNDLIAGTKTGVDITDADLQNALRNRYGDAVDILANQNKYVNDPDKITAALNSVALVDQLDSIKTLSELGKLPDNAESLAQSLFGQNPVGRNQAQAQIRQEANSIQELAAAFNAGPDARTAEQWQLMFNLLGVNSKGEVNEAEASKAIQDQLDVWMTFLDKIAESNPEMQTFVDNVKTMLGGGNISKIDLKTNLLDTHEVQLSTTSLLEYVDQLVAAGEAGEKMFGNLPKNIKQQLMNFGGLADFMKTYGENTAEAAKAQRDLTLSIVTGTLEALEQEGKIISGISGQMETMLFGNDVDRKKQTNQMIDQITEYANVREAYNRLISGDRTRQEDWDTFQGFWNISDRRLQEYQLGQRSLITDYGKEMESVTDLQQETAKNAVEAILRAEAGENGYIYDYSDIPYVAEMQRRGQAPKVKARQKTLEEMISEMTTDQIADFNRKYSELGLSIDENGQLQTDDAALQKLTVGQQLRLNLMNRDQIIGNKGRESDAETMLNLFDTLGGNKDLLARTVDLYQWNSSAIEELMNNEDFIEALDKGNNSAARRMIAEIGGRTLPNRTRMSDVEKYISAALSGDRETLETMTEADVKEFANNIAGFQEAYNAVMDNMTLTDEQRKTLEGGAAYQRVRELEQAGTVRKGTADLASQLATGTVSEQRSLIGQQASIAHESQRTVDIMDYLIEHSGESNEAMWKEFQQRENLDDDAIKHYKESTDALKRLRDEEQAEANQVVESLKAAIKSALNLDDFSDIGNGLHEAFKNLLSDSLNVEGLELITDNEGNVDIKEQKQKTPWEILTGTGQGTYNADYETKQRRNEFVQLLRDSSSLEDFQQRYNEAAANTPWMQNKTDVRSVIGQDYATMIEQMQSGRYSWDQIQNMFTQASGYSPLYKDQKFDLGLSKMQEYFGSNFGVSDNVDFSDSSIKSFSDYVASGDGQVALDFLSQFKQGTEFLETLNSGNLDDLKSTMRALNNEIAGSKVQNLNKYKDDTEAVAQNIMDLGKNARTSVTAVGGLISKMNQLSDKATAAQKARGKSGKDLDSKTRGVLSSATGLGEQDIKQLTADQVDQLAKMVEASAEEEFEATIGNTLAEQATRTISEALAGSNIDVAALVHFDVNGDGNFDMSELAALAQQLDDEALATLASYAGKIADLVLEYNTTADSISVEAVLHSLLGGGGYKGAGGGGGGGGGKSAAQELMEELKRAKALRDHEIKMIQYQETKYENAGEIGNQNRMIELENVAQQKLIKTLEDAISKTKQQMAQTKKGSDDWYSLYESVLTYEEGIEEANQAIADNTRKIKENEQAILKLHTDLEQAVDEEIRNRIQMQRDMLDGTVSMEDIVLEAIRQRYRDEWALIQKDIEKKKTALEEEKNLIDERLQRRKDAEDEAEKYEELAEYKRQLALISLDSTRTKDAAKLREQIANLEKEQAWNIAQDEADYQKEQIDEQIQAYDDFVTYGDEDLEEFLANANNMADEVNGVMQLSQEGMMDWLKDNVKEYTLAMDAAQKQMIQGWTDTYEQMLGITHTYWDEIAQILSGKDTWLAYMQQSQEYIDASTDERAQMLYEWSEMYDNWLLAQKRDAIYNHTDDDLSDTGSSGKGGGGGGKANKDSLKVDINWNKDIELGIRNAISPGIDPNGVEPSSGTKEPAAGSKVQNGKTDAIVNPLITWVNTIFGTHFDNGGLVNYTGPAWVDGTKTKPEAFLDAEDTALIRGFLDQAQYVRYRSTVSNIDSNSFGGNSQNIGEVIVNITEAQFKDDADFDEVAQRVGQQFVKEISKQGFNTMSYSF